VKLVLGGMCYMYEEVSYTLVKRLGTAYVTHLFITKLHRAVPAEDRK